MRAARIGFGLIAVLGLGACGSKSPLTIPDPVRFDGGVDAGRDAGPPDTGVDGGPPIDECVELPFREPPREVRIRFLSQIQSADIFFLVDVTGSMGEEINQIRNRLRDEIVPGLAEQIPDARFSVGHFADFNEPEHNYGEPDDDLFVLLQPSTSSVSAVQSAVERLPLQGGRDGPEAMVEALYLAASGEGFPGYVPPRSCPPDTIGYPCFRTLGTRIVLAFSDAPTHNGPGGHDPYRAGTITPPPHTYEMAVNALRGIGAKVLGLYSGGEGGIGRDDLEALARDTGAVRPDGTPVVLDIQRDGRLLGASVVEAVRTLVDEVPIDVDVVLEDYPADEVDATRFLDRVVALSARPTDGAVNLGDRFADVAPGTELTFQILLHNEIIPQREVPTSFLLWVVLRGDGVTRLQETLVQILVPAIGGGGCDDL